MTPIPISKPHPQLLVNNTNPTSARHATRFGLPFSPTAHVPELETLYNEELETNGKTDMYMIPPPNTTLNFIHEDPNQT